MMWSLRWGTSALVVAMLAVAAPRAITKQPRTNGSASACALAATAKEQALLRVPFRIVDGRIYVDAKVDGKGPFVFAIDTGASGMGRADTSLAATLGLAAAGSSTTSDGVATAEVRTVHLSSVELGGFVRRNLDVITRDYSSKMKPEAAFSGILGRAFFADGLLVIDYPARQLTFTRALALQGNEQDVLSYDRAFRVPVRIGDILTEGNLDTGANVSFVLPKTLFDRVGGGAIEAAGEGRLTNTVVQTGRANVKGPFRIGGAALADVEVRVSERYPELLVGAHALQHFTMLIDQRSQKDRALLLMVRQSHDGGNALTLGAGHRPGGGTYSFPLVRGSTGHVALSGESR